MGCVCANDDRKDFPDERKKESSDAQQSPVAQPRFVVRRLSAPLSRTYRFKSTAYESDYVKVAIAECLTTSKECFVKGVTLGDPGTAKKRGKALRNEATALTKLDHPHIVKLHEVLEDEGHLYLVTESCGAGSICGNLNANKSFSEQQAAVIMRQVFGLVAYCHTQGVMLRSLGARSLHFAERPEECQIDVKLVDVSDCCDISSPDDRKPIPAITEFHAPEVLSATYNEKCDLWNCGVLLFTLISGEAPYLRDPSDDLREHVQRGTVHYSKRRWQGRSKEVMSLLNNLFSLDSASRLSPAECLLHPWIDRFATKETSKQHPLAEVIAQLRNYSEANNWKRTVLLLILNRIIDGSQLAPVSHTFDALDTNRDGFIGAGELLAGLNTVLSPPLAQSEATRILQLLDYDGDGRLSYSEFLLGALNPAELLTPANLRAVFTLLDCDNDGRISLQDARNCFLRGDCEDAERRFRKQCENRPAAFEDFLAIFEV